MEKRTAFKMLSAEMLTRGIGGSISTSGANTTIGLRRGVRNLPLGPTMNLSIYLVRSDLPGRSDVVTKPV